MDIKVVELPSGFWAVFADEQMLYAASPNREHAEQVADWARNGGTFPSLPGIKRG